MTSTEYKYWVNFATKNYIKIPAVLVHNYLDWRHRSILGRYLLRAGERIAAIKVLRSVIGIPISQYRDDNRDLSEIEDQVWCLQDLAAAVWAEEKNETQALAYLDEALKLADSYSYKFYFVERGLIWRDRLEILRAVGRITEAKMEAANRIRTTVALPGKSNSVLFNAYDFLADIAAQSGKIKAALWLMREALRYFPDDYNTNSQMKEIMQSSRSHPRTAYERLKELTTVEHLLWDDAGEE